MAGPRYKPSRVPKEREPIIHMPVPSKGIEDLIEEVESVESIPAEVASQELAEVPQKQPNRYIDEIHNEFIESIGDVRELKAALSQSTSPKAQRFLELLVDPKNSGQSMTRLARRSGVEPQDVMEVFRSYYLAQSMLEYVKGAPRIARDIVLDAQSTEEECPRCDGWGKIKDADDKKVECKRCKGAGTIRIPGNSDARKLMAESVGWTRKGSGSGGGAHGITINLSHTGVESVIEEMERLGPNPKTIDLP